MLETIIRRKWYLQKHLDAPLLKERENYLAFMAEKRNYSHNYLLSLADYLLLIVTSLKLEDGFSEQVPISSIKDAAITWSKTDTQLPLSAGMCSPHWAMAASRPMVFSVTVLPPVLGPVMTRVSKSPPNSTSMGTALSLSSRG